MSGVISHRDDLVVVDPQQVSDNNVLPLLCAETEAEHGQSHDTHDDIYQFGSQQTYVSVNAKCKGFPADDILLEKYELVHISP